mgnify:CR=1 FL=1
MKNIREWFPHAEVTDQANPPAGYVAIPLRAHQWLLLKEEELTEREKQLISWLGGEEELAPNPWYQYLIDGKGEAPQVIKKMQLVYCHLSHSTALPIYSVATEWAGLCAHSGPRPVFACGRYLKRYRFCHGV